MRLVFDSRCTEFYTASVYSKIPLLSRPSTFEMSIVTAADPRIVLASGSPRRLELCRQIGFDPIVVVSNVPESPADGETPTDYTCRLARQKAADVARQLEGDDDLPDWILAADTIVVFDDQILEKPDDDAHATEMLMQLSGTRHQVITTFCWMQRSTGADRVVPVVADVVFRELDPDEARRYAATGEPMDKAGAYGIQGLGGVFVDRLEGSYFAVVGLPIAEVVHTLADLGGLGPYPFVPDNS